MFGALFFTLSKVKKNTLHTLSMALHFVALYFLLAFREPLVYGLLKSGTAPLIAYYLSYFIFLSIGVLGTLNFILCKKWITATVLLLTALCLFYFQTIDASILLPENGLASSSITTLMVAQLLIHIPQRKIKIKLIFADLLAMAITVVMLSVQSPVYINDFQQPQTESVEHPEKVKRQIEQVAQGQVPLNSHTGLIALYTTSCPYCLRSATFLSALKDKSAPCIYLIDGSLENIQEFRELTHSTFPVFQNKSRESFFQLTKGTVPQFYWLENGEPQASLNGSSFNFAALQAISEGKKP